MAEEPGAIGARHERRVTDRRRRGKVRRLAAGARPIRGRSLLFSGSGESILELDRTEAWIADSKFPPGLKYHLAISG
jgi:hypothetical protein